MASWTLNWLGAKTWQHVRDFPTGELRIESTRKAPYNVYFRWNGGDITTIKCGVYFLFVAKFWGMRWIRKGGCITKT